MKKIVIAMAIGLAAVTYGSVNINWQADAGFYFTSSGLGILGDGAGGSTRAQLMYSANAVQDAGNGLTGIGINGLGFNGGDDLIWGSIVVTENGSAGDFDEYATFPVQNYQQSFVAGYVYAMIFQDSVLNANDWYYYTPMVSVADITGLTLPQGIQLNTDLVNGNAIDSGATVGQVQAIPEPATFLLFAIGGMGAWMIRRNKMQVKEEADA